MPQRSSLPILAVTMGDPAGIGPEIIVKAFLHPSLHEEARLLVTGDSHILREAVRLVGAALEVRSVSGPEEALFREDTIDVVDTSDSAQTPILRGVATREGGQAAYDAIARAVELAQAGRVDATVTAPIHKEALHLCGCPDAGHTEIYARLTHAENPVMLLVSDRLRVSHVSTHVSMLQACALVKKERVYEVIALTHRALRDFGLDRAKIAVAGLNPHAGENGLFGTEEIREIAPAVAKAQAEGMDVHGPVSPDAVFFQAASGQYDAVVAMYHDQGHIPIKTMGFTMDSAGGMKSLSGVNITLGIPILRVSVDHGTAFDKAWRGIAREDSLVEAAEWAARLAKGRTRHAG